MAFGAIKEFMDEIFEEKVTAGAYTIATSPGYVREEDMVPAAQVYAKVLFENQEKLRKYSEPSVASPVRSGRGEKKRIPIIEESFNAYFFNPVMNNTDTIIAIAANLKLQQTRLANMGYGNIYAPFVIEQFYNIRQLKEKLAAMKVKIESHVQGAFEYQIDKPDFESLFIVYDIFMAVPEIKNAIETKIRNVIMHYLNYHRITFTHINVLNRLFFEYLYPELVVEALSHIRLFRNGEGLNLEDIDLGNLQVVAKNTFATLNEGQIKIEFFQGQHKKLEEILLKLLKEEVNEAIKINSVIVLSRLILIENDYKERFSKLLQHYKDKKTIISILKYFLVAYRNQTYITGEALKRFRMNTFTIYQQLISTKEASSPVVNGSSSEEINKLITEIVDKSDSAKSLGRVAGGVLSGKGK